MYNSKVPDFPLWDLIPSIASNCTCNVLKSAQSSVFLFGKYEGFDCHDLFLH